MKKCLSLILVLVLMLGLIGCKKQQTFSFYYPRTEILYGVNDGVIAPEERKVEVSDPSLDFLLKLYLEGPVSQDLRTPFPKGTALTGLKFQEDSIYVLLSPSFNLLEDLNYVIACACIASTCFALTGANSVTVATGQTEMTLTREALYQSDYTAGLSPD